MLFKTKTEGVSMKYWALAFVFIGFCGGWASAQNLDGYTHLAKQFEAAGPLTLAELDGWYSGRCFERLHKATALPGLLVISESGLGPQFPNSTQTHIKNYIGSGLLSNPETFDLINTEQELASLAKLVFESIALRVKPAKVESKGLLVEELFSNENNVATRLEIRKINDLFYSRLTTATHRVEHWSRASAQYFTHEKGAVIEICYFFKKIIDKAEIERLK